MFWIDLVISRSVFLFRLISLYYCYNISWTIKYLAIIIVSSNQNHIYVISSRPSLLSLLLTSRRTNGNGIPFQVRAHAVSATVCAGKERSFSRCFHGSSATKSFKRQDLPSLTLFLWFLLGGGSTRYCRWIREAGSDSIQRREWTLSYSSSFFVCLFVWVEMFVGESIGKGLSLENLNWFVCILLSWTRM